MSIEKVLLLMSEKLSYASAGVDINEGEAAVRSIKKIVEATSIDGVMSKIGGFGGLFDLSVLDMAEPVLVSSTDGVGTKAYLAGALGSYKTIGIDLVAMCVDDIAVLGARPLFLLDYLSVGKLDSNLALEIVGGIAEGAKAVGAALIGGEMAEHPGSMTDGHFDLGGFVVGVVEKSKILGSHLVRAGDSLVAIESPNLRSNGFSLARRALLGNAGDIDHGGNRDLFQTLVDAKPFDDGRTLGQILMEPSVLYSPILQELSKTIDIHAGAHITGGGIEGNLSRVLKDGERAIVKRDSWEIPPIFSLIQRSGAIDDDEMFRVFNMGVGMVLVIDHDQRKEAIATIELLGHRAYEIGSIESAAKGVELR